MLIRNITTPNIKEFSKETLVSIQDLKVHLLQRERSTTFLNSTRCTDRSGKSFFKHRHLLNISKSQRHVFSFLCNLRLPASYKRNGRYPLPSATFDEQHSIVHLKNY